MPSSTHLVTLVAAASSVAATFQGFNYDAKVDGRGKTKAEFANEFKVAASLEGTNGGFTSARLFTTVQVGTTDKPIEAIPAAIESKTSLLLGVWCSAGKETFNNEIRALKNTAKEYCGNGLDDLLAGISVGSEDLYRESPIGKVKGKDPGLDPQTLVGYIGEVRKAVKGTCLEKAPIGHVDTWNAYVEAANKPVIEAIDWIGADEYPYFESDNNDVPNHIENGSFLFNDAIRRIQKAAGEDKEIWITESGWPVSGKDSNKAVASIENAETYYQDVACDLFGKRNVWWYTLQDGAPSNSPTPSFGLVGGQLQSKPLYNLSCDKAHKSPSSTKSSDDSSKTAVPSSESSSSSGPGSSSDSGSNSGSGSKSDSGSNSDYSSGSGSNGSSGSSGSSGSNGSNGSNSGSNSGTVSPPFAGGANTTNAGGAQPSGGLRPGSGNQPGGAVIPSEVPRAGGSQLNSLGAAAVALVLAIAVL